MDVCLQVFIHYICYRLLCYHINSNDISFVLFSRVRHIIIIIIMVYRITGLSSLYDSLVCVAVWSNFIGSCLQYSSSLFLNALILIAFTTSLGRLFHVFAIRK